MKAGILRQLKLIGWDYVAWTAPNQSRRLVHDLLSAAIEPTPQDDKAQVKVLTSLEENIAKCLHDLGQLNSNALSFVDTANTPLERRDQGSDKTVRQAQAALAALSTGVTDSKELLSHRVSKVKPGNQPNFRAHDAAKAIAEIYVIGLGEKPTYGLAPVKPGPSTLYGQVMANILEELDIASSNLTIGHLKKAVEYVNNPAVFQKLISYRNGNGRSEKFSIAYYRADTV